MDSEATPTTCDVVDCETPLFAVVYPTHGDTDHHASRCRDCLLDDLSRDWFVEWGEKIEGRA